MATPRGVNGLSAFGLLDANYDEGGQDCEDQELFHAFTLGRRSSFATAERAILEKTWR